MDVGWTRISSLKVIHPHFGYNYVGGLISFASTVIFFYLH